MTPARRETLCRSEIFFPRADPPAAASSRTRAGVQPSALHFERLDVRLHAGQSHAQRSLHLEKPCVRKPPAQRAQHAARSRQCAIALLLASRGGTLQSRTDAPKLHLAGGARCVRTVAPEAAPVPAPAPKRSPARRRCSAAHRELIKHAEDATRGARSRGVNSGSAVPPLARAHLERPRHSFADDTLAGDSKGAGVEDRSSARCARDTHRRRAPQPHRARRQNAVSISKPRCASPSTAREVLFRDLGAHSPPNEMRRGAPRCGRRRFKPRSASTVR